MTNEEADSIKYLGGKSRNLMCPDRRPKEGTDNSRQKRQNFEIIYWREKNLMRVISTSKGIIKKYVRGRGIDVTDDIIDAIPGLSQLANTLHITVVKSPKYILTWYQYWK